MKQQILVDSQITSISDDGRLSPDVPGPVSPILLLPYELLAEILVLAVVTPVAIVNDVLSLSQICSYMRQVALSTPQLWAQQIFPITFGVDPGISVIATELFLERSAPLPISVVVDMGRNVLVLPANVISAARRWESIEIYSSLGNEAAIQSEPLVLAQIPAGRLDSLKKVVLLSYNKEIWQNSVTVFQSAPQLVDLFLGVPDGLPAIACMSWPRLTHLSVAFDMPQICLGMLEHCTNVVSVELDIEGPQNFLDASPMKEIHLRHLEVLKIHITFYSTKDHLIPFLRYLKLPALQSLSVFLDLDFRDDASSLTHPLQRFLTQAPSLRYLCTNCTRAADIRDVLQHTPSLTELEFVSRDINDSFLEGLRYSDADSDHLAPKLDMLTLRDVGNGFSELSLAEAIRSRWWSDDELLAKPVPPSVTRLKEVTLEHPKYNPMDFTQEFQETMKAYRLQGLILNGFESPEGLDVEH